MGDAKRKQEQRAFGEKALGKMQDAVSALPDLKARAEAVGRAVYLLLNSDSPQAPKYGFVLMAFPFDDPTKPACVSNGGAPPDLVKLLREQADFLEKSIAERIAVAVPAGRA